MTNEPTHPTRSPAEEPATGLAWCAIQAFAGGAFYGLVDGASVVAAETLDLSKLQQGLLMVLDALSLGVIAILATLPAKWMVDRLRPGLIVQPGWTLFLASLALAGFLDLTEYWLTDPPPHTEAPAMHGNIAIWIGAGVLFTAMAGILGRMVAPGRPRFYTILALCGSLTIWGQSTTRVLIPLGDPEPDSPNILLITLDTTRADHFGAYGNEHVRTPYFDEFSSEGVLFERAIAQIPVTGPSHATILSGLGPWTHGGLLNGVPVADDIPLLSETLRENGYQTGAFTSAYVLDRSVRLERGFQVYDDDFGLLKGWARTLPGRLLAGLDRHLDPTHVLERKGERTVDEALEWLKGAEENTYLPFFAWVHLFDPHGPYEPPAPWDTRYYEGDPRDPAHHSMDQVEGVAAYLEPSLEGITDVQWVLDQYAGEISYTDDQIGRLLDWLDEAGIAENTLVIIVGDHGESLGEHNSWFNHGDDLFEPSLHVPLAMRLPETIPAGAVISEPVELTDLVPTLHEILDIQPPDRTDGLSLVPTWTPGSPARARPLARSICFDREANIEARAAGQIDSPTWRMVALSTAVGRYVYREADGYPSELYRHTEYPPLEEEAVEPDPGEEEFLISQAEAVLNGMSLEDLQQASQRDDSTREMLEQLGYIE